MDCTIVLIAIAFIAPPTRVPIDPRLKPLIEALATEDRRKHEDAVEALRKAITEKDIPALVRAGEDGRALVRDGIFLAMWKFGGRPVSEPMPIPVDYVIRRLKDESPRVRARATSSCGFLYSHYPKKLGPLIVEALDDHGMAYWRPDSEQTVASGAIIALRLFGTKARPLYPKLIELTEKGTPWERIEAINTLGWFVKQDPSWRAAVRSISRQWPD